MKDNFGIALPVDLKPKNRHADTALVVGIADYFKIIIQEAILPISSKVTRIVVAAKIAVPLSMGKLQLNNTDPRLNPLVKFNYLASESDLDECDKMGRLIERVARSKSVATFVGSRHRKVFTSSMKWQDFIKKM